MRQGMRVYGRFEGLSSEAAAELAELCAPAEATFEDGVLHIEHEGFVFGVEAAPDKAAELMTPGAEGNLDVIDHDEGVVKRFVVKDGKVRSKVVSINDVLAAYQYE